MLPHSRTGPARARLLLLVLCAALSACTGQPPEKRAEKLSTLSFDPQIEIVSAAGEAPAQAEASAQEIVATLTRWYQRAFIDPDGWSDTDEIVAQFVGDARAQIRKELASVTLGPARKEVSAVRPIGTKMKVTLYVGSDAAPTYAIASVIFDANGILKKKGLPLHIVQRGTYYLRREGSAWKIFAYSARTDEAQNLPTPGPSS